MKLRKLHKPSDDAILEEAAADEILKNVFKESKVKPNKVPLEVLTSYSSYRKERFSLRKILLVLIMLLFLALPLLFVKPRVTLDSMTPDETKNTPIYLLNVDTFIPTKKITATIDGQNISVYEASATSYTIEPALNGQMIVTVTLLNEQQVVKTIDVGNVDREQPVLISYTTDYQNVYLQVEDSGSGINFAEIYASDTAGNTVRPTSWNETTGEIIFPYPSDTLNAFIPDNSENTLQLVIAVHR